MTDSILYAVVAAFALVDVACAGVVLYYATAIITNAAGIRVGKFRARATILALAGAVAKIGFSIMDTVVTLSSMPAWDSSVIVEYSMLGLSARIAAGHASSAALCLAVALFLRASFHATDTTLKRGSLRMMFSSRSARESGEGRVA